MTGRWNQVQVLEYVAANPRASEAEVMAWTWPRATQQLVDRGLVVRDDSPDPGLVLSRDGWLALDADVEVACTDCGHGSDLHQWGPGQRREPCTDDDCTCPEFQPYDRQGN